MWEATRRMRAEKNDKILPLKTDIMIKQNFKYVLYPTNFNLK